MYLSIPQATIADPKSLNTIHSDIDTMFQEVYETKCVSITEYGGSIDSTDSVQITDNGPAIREAIDVVKDAGGGTVIIPARLGYKCYYNSEFSLPESVSIKGVACPSNGYPKTVPEAWGSILLPGPDVVRGLVVENGVQGSYVGFLYIDMVLMDNALYPIGLLADGVHHSVFDNLFVTGMPGNNSWGVIRRSTDIGSGWNRFTRVLIVQKSGMTKTGNGIFIDGVPELYGDKTNQDTWESCHVRNCYGGWKIRGAGNSQILINCAWEGNAQYGLITQNQKATYVTVIGGECTNNNIGFDGNISAWNVIGWKNKAEGIPVWETGTSYTGGHAGFDSFNIQDQYGASILTPPGDYRLHEGRVYRCTVSHTSDSTNCPGTGALWMNYWTLFTSRDSIQANLTAVTMVETTARMTVSSPLAGTSFLMDLTIQTYDITTPSELNKKQYKCSNVSEDFLSFDIKNLDNSNVDLTGLSAYTGGGRVRVTSATFGGDMLENRGNLADATLYYNNKTKFRQFGGVESTVTVSSGDVVFPTSSCMTLTPSGSGTIMLYDGGTSGIPGPIANGSFPGQLLFLSGDSNNAIILPTRTSTGELNNLRSYRPYVSLYVYNGILLKWTGTYWKDLSSDYDPPSVTSTDLSSAVSPINLARRYGIIIYNSTAGRPMVSMGATSTSPWKALLTDTAESPLTITPA